jgi:hypothetical protein
MDAGWSLGAQTSTQLHDESDGVQDLVREVAAGAALKTNNHRIFKLEDISMGSWIEYVAKEKGWGIQYVSYNGFDYSGCNPHDVVSHYIRPAQARCIFSHNSRSCCPGVRSMFHLFS